MFRRVFCRPVRVYPDVAALAGGGGTRLTQPHAVGPILAHVSQRAVACPSAFLIVVAVLLLTTAVAYGQSASSPPVEDVRKEARIHAGPFYMTPVLLLKELGIDTNVFNQAGEQKSDFTFTVTPRTDLWVPFGRRALVSTSVGSDLVWYRKYTSERSVDPQLVARGEIYLHRFTLFAGDSYVSSRQRPNFEIDLRSRHVEIEAQAGITYRVTPKFALEVTARRGITEYDADAFFLGNSLRETLSRRTRGGSVTARQRLSALTTVAVRAEKFGDRFAYAHERDTDSIRIMPGVEFKPRALVSGSAWVGFRRFTPRDPEALPAYSGLVAQLDLSYTLLGATTFGVSYNRDINYSFEQLQPYYVSNAVGASIRRALGGRFDVLVSADRYLYDYRDLRVATVLTVAAAQPRQDVTWNYGGSIGYRVGRDGRVAFGASYSDRTSSTRTFRDYSGLRVGTSVSYGF